MEYSYKFPLAEKKFLTHELSDIPQETEEFFDEFWIRLHEDKSIEGYFFLTVAVPAKRDDEGFVWEKEILSEMENSGGGDYYSIPQGDFSPDQLLDNIELSFAYVKDKRSGNYMQMRTWIKNTSFRGIALFLDDFFEPDGFAEE